MRRPFAILALLLFVATTAGAQTGQLTIVTGTDRVLQIWDSDQGLPNTALSDTLQTRDGYLWLATWGGIFRFDGVRFTPLPVQLPNIRATQLHEDGDGSVWIGTYGGGVSHVTNGTQRTFTIAEGLAGDYVTRIDQDSSGAIWVVTEGGVSRITGDQVKSWRPGAGLVDQAVGVGDSRGGVVLATRSRTCRLDRDAWRCGPARTTAGATAFLIDRAGRQWLGTLSGLYGFDADGQPSGPCGSGCFIDREVSTLAEARDGSLWIGFSATGGVARLQGHKATMYGDAIGVPKFNIAGISEDAEGSIWVTPATGGLTQLRPSRVATYSQLHGLPTPTPTSIVEDRDGNIWAGASCGPVVVKAAGREVFETKWRRETNDACVLSVLSTPNGDLWLGTEKHFLYRWNGQQLEQFAAAAGVLEPRVDALFADRDGAVWFSTPQALYRSAGGRIERMFSSDRQPGAKAIVTMAQDASGRIWIGSNGQGLTVYEHGRFRSLGDSVPLPTRNVSALIVDSRDALWIGTADRALFRLQAGKLQPFGLEQGFNDPLIALMIEDRDANIWVGTARGITRLDRAQIEDVASGRAATLQPILIDRNDGMRQIEGMGGGFDPSGLRARDGRLWFSTIDGIVLIDPATFPINRVPARPLIESVIVDGKVPARDERGRWVVPAGSESIEWTYTGFSLLVPTRSRFRYRLTGAETQWHEAGTRRIASYAQIPPGDYTFEVSAANNDGIWSEQPAVMRIVVQPLFLERTSVRATAIALLLVATGLVVNALARRRERRRLEDLEREQALTRERTRIARDLHDDLGSRLSQIALIAETTRTPELLDRISSTAREALQTMDELVWAVDAQNDTLESLAGYVAEFAESHLAGGSRRVRLQIQPDLRDRDIGTDARRHLFLAFKEASHNIVKHAQATEVRVALAADDAGVSLEIYDNGVGIPVAQAGMGNGLRNMRERMQAAGGTMDVETAPGQGTRIVFRVPIASRAS